MQRAFPQWQLVPLCHPGKRGLLAAHLPWHSSTTFTTHHIICSRLSSVPGSQVPSRGGTSCSQLSSKSPASRCNPQCKSQVPAAHPALLLHTLSASPSHAQPPSPSRGCEGLCECACTHPCPQAVQNNAINAIWCRDRDPPVQGARHGFSFPLISSLGAAGLCLQGSPGGRCQGTCTLKGTPVPGALAWLGTAEDGEPWPQECETPLRLGLI